MNRLLLLSAGALVAACTTPSESACQSGLRETFTSTVTTNTGTVDVETTQCVSSKWTFTECEAGSSEHCWWMFEPHTPAKVPLELIFDDFVFKHSVGSLTISRPEVILDAQDVYVGLQTVVEDRVAEGYFASPVQPFTMFDGSQGYEVTISCDHPDIDPLCPYTWRYSIVDLSDRADDLYADFSIRYANFVDAGNVAAPLPSEFEDYQQMIDTVTLEVDGA